MLKIQIYQVPAKNRVDHFLSLIIVYIYIIIIHFFIRNTSGYNAKEGPDEKDDPHIIDKICIKV